MKKKLIIISLIIILIILTIAFNSSYQSLTLSNIAVVVAMAVDTSDTNTLKVTFQFTKASTVSEAGNSEKDTSIIYSVDSSSISSAINLMNAYVGKELGLSHCKLIVFSEEIAQKGISNEMFTLMNDNQVRPSTNIIISKCDAKYYIENSKPIFEPLITKYYEGFTNSSSYTGYTTDATIGTFFNNLNCKTCEPFAILGGINTDSQATSTSIPTQKDSDIKANESAITGKLRAENIGLAVFKDDKLVGELTALENLAFLCTKNKVDGFLISIPNPQDENKSIDIYLTPHKSTKINTSIVNGAPYVNANYSFTGRIYSMDENSDYLDNSLLTEISNRCNSYLESVFSSLLYKTSKEFNSDIIGIGKSAMKNFSTSSQFDDFNWKENYKNSFFEVKVDTNVKSGFLIM